MRIKRFTPFRRGNLYTDKYETLRKRGHTMRTDCNEENGDKSIGRRSTGNSALNIDDEEKENLLFKKIENLLKTFHLSPIAIKLAMQWLKMSFSEPEESNLDDKDLKSKSKRQFGDKNNEEHSLYHVQKWILSRIGGKSHLLALKDSISPYQYYCPELIPGLRSKPVWSSEDFPWATKLLENFSAIREELLSLRGQSGFQPYRSPKLEENKEDVQSHMSSDKETGKEGIKLGLKKPEEVCNSVEVAGEKIGVDSDSETKKECKKDTNDEGEWNVYYLYLHNLDFEANRAKCPVTTSLIHSINTQYHHAFFSALAPGTHVLPHNGPTNKKLRIQLPIFIPPGGASLRVGDDIYPLKEGEILIFDDSFEHEAWNHDSNLSRIILIFDIWHPDLSQKEIKFFEFLRNAQLRAGKKIADQNFKDNNSQSETVNFFDAIERGKKERANQEAIWSITNED